MFLALRTCAPACFALFPLLPFGSLGAFLIPCLLVLHVSYTSPPAIRLFVVFQALYLGGDVWWRLPVVRATVFCSHFFVLDRKSVV